MTPRHEDDLDMTLGEARALIGTGEKAIQVPPPVRVEIRQRETTATGFSVRMTPVDHPTGEQQSNTHDMLGTSPSTSV